MNVGYVRDGGIARTPSVARNLRATGKGPYPDQLTIVAADAPETAQSLRKWRRYPGCCPDGGPVAPAIRCLHKRLPLRHDRDVPAVRLLILDRDVGHHTHAR